MSKEFVPYELAVALKELGFDEPCIAYYTFATQRLSRVGIGEYGVDFVTVVTKDLYEGYTIAPLWQQAFEWLLYKKGVNATVDWIFYDGFHYYFKYTFPDGSYGTSDDHTDTPEESRLECLKKIIELLKERLKNTSKS